MTDYTKLLGSEDVARAGRQIQAAAESMRQTSGLIDDTLSRFMREYTEQVERLLRIARVQVRIEAMRAENANRELRGMSPAYGEGHFQELEARLLW